MNAEALAHAAKACRESSDVLVKAADDADVFLHRCPDAGRGMRHVSDEMRDRAIGLRVASSILSRFERQPRLMEVLAALEAGQDVLILPPAVPVIVRDHQDPAAPLTLRERVNRLLPWRVRKAA